MPRGKEVPHFTFIILNYNATPEQTERCIRSCCDQNWGKFRVVWIDDHSDTLDSYKTAVSLLDEYRDRLSVGREPQRTYGMEALKDAIEMAEEDNPGTVIIPVGGDDYVHMDLLGHHATHYYNGAWAVYNQSWDGPEGVPFGAAPGWEGRAAPLPAHMSVRQAPFVTLFGSFKASLFLKIREEHLKIHGRWVDVSADTHIWFPILEMAAERVVYEPAILYRYHCEEGSGAKREGEYYALQSFMSWRSRHMMPYARLESLKAEAELDINDIPVMYTLIAVNPWLIFETRDDLGTMIVKGDSAADSK